MVPDLRRFPMITYDTETTGLSPNAGARVFGFSLSLPDGKDYYYDIREQPEAVAMLNVRMAEYEGKVGCHNLSFDYRMSEATGLHIPLEQAFCTSIQACLIDEHEMSYSLDNLARKYTKDFKKGDELYKDLAALYGGRATKAVQMKNIHRAPSSVVAPYAKGDTRATWALADYQRGEMAKQGLQPIRDFEREVTPILIKAEQHGIKVNTVKAQRALEPLTVEINRVQKELDGVAGFPCNAQPSKDIKRLFNPKWADGRWTAIDGTPLKETNSGAASLDAEALRKMGHPAAKLILEIRSLLKTRDTFLVGHVLESSEGGRVYPTINQVKGDDGGTGTGRLSYCAPALQQIPDRNKEVAQIVKEVFEPDEDHTWVDMDMASFEVRVFGHLINTPAVIQAYEDDPEQDFHQFVAELTGLNRNATYTGEPNAKQLNLSVIFNQGDGTTAEKMGMPWEWASFTDKKGKEVVYKKAGPAAARIIDMYHARLPGVKKLARGCKKTAESRGHLFTRRGRHLRFPKGYKSYKASGILIQATSADENKQNWIVIDEALRGTGARQLLNTHDSYSLSIPKGDEERVCRRVKEAIEEDRGLRVPLILEVQRPGSNWWDSKNSKRWM